MTIDLQPIGHAPLVGEVVEFDEPRGLGVLRPEVGRRLDFHCTAIEDGSRRIEVGTIVTFRVRAGRLGRLEAASLRPLQPEPGSTEGVSPTPSSASGGTSDGGSSDSSS